VSAGSGPPRLEAKATQQRRKARIGAERVVGVPNATDGIRSGALITVDGTAGLLVVREPAGEGAPSVR
jgi:hypothetical protein